MLRRLGILSCLPLENNMTLSKRKIRQSGSRRLQFSGVEAPPASVCVGNDCQWVNLRSSPQPIPSNSQYWPSSSGSPNPRAFSTSDSAPKNTPERAGVATKSSTALPVAVEHNQGTKHRRRIPSATAPPRPCSTTLSAELCVTAVQANKTPYDGSFDARLAPDSCQ